jgi:uncharacterized protein YecA (UPF0149 family)
MITPEQTKLFLDQIGISPDTFEKDKLEKLMTLADRIKDPSQVDGNTIVELQKLLGIKNLPQKKTTPSKKIGRNTPCPCNSGKKWKKCCGF